MSETPPRCEVDGSDRASTPHLRGHDNITRPQTSTARYRHCLSFLTHPACYTSTPRFHSPFSPGLWCRHRPRPRAATHPLYPR